MSDTSRALSFGAQARLYNDSRPTYPRALVQWALAGSPTSPVVVDLAAGTGKLTEVLVPYAGRLTAIEPDQAMREQLIRQLPQITALDGKDTSMPLPDHSVDALFVAQAWHWFDEEKASDEIRRILKPGGVLVIVSNMKDDSVPWVREFSRMSGSGSVASSPEREPKVTWGSGEPFEHAWAWQRTIPQLVDLALSTSWAISQSDTERAALKEEALALLTPLADGNNNLALPYLTRARRFTAP